MYLHAASVDYGRRASAPLPPDRRSHPWSVDRLQPSNRIRAAATPSLQVCLHAAPPLPPHGRSHRIRRSPSLRRRHRHPSHRAPGKSFLCRERRRPPAWQQDQPINMTAALDHCTLKNKPRRTVILAKAFTSVVMPLLQWCHDPSNLGLIWEYTIIRAECSIHWQLWNEM
jgi:hypothetical protein